MPTTIREPYHIDWYIPLSMWLCEDFGVEDGWNKILLGAAFITSTFLMGLISANNHAWSLNYHKVTIETLQRLLSACFLQNRDEYYF